MGDWPSRRYLPLRKRAQSRVQWNENRPRGSYSTPFPIFLSPSIGVLTLDSKQFGDGAGIRAILQLGSYSIIYWSKRPELLGLTLYLFCLVSFSSPAGSWNNPLALKPMFVSISPSVPLSFAAPGLWLGQPKQKRISLSLQNYIQGLTMKGKKAAFPVGCLKMKSGSEGA